MRGFGKPIQLRDFLHCRRVLVSLFGWPGMSSHRESNQDNANCGISDRTLVMHLPPPFKQLTRVVTTDRVGNLRLASTGYRAFRMRCRMLACSCPILLMCLFTRFALRTIRIVHKPGRLLSGQKCTISAYMPNECKFRARQKLRKSAKLTANYVLYCRAKQAYARYWCAAVLSCSATLSRNSGGESTSTSEPCLRISIINSGSWL